MGLTWLQRTGSVSSASSETNEKTRMAFNVTIFGANMRNFQNQPVRPPKSDYLVPPSKLSHDRCRGVSSVQNQCWRQQETKQN